MSKVTIISWLEVESVLEQKKSTNPKPRVYYSQITFSIIIIIIKSHKRTLIFVKPTFQIIPF